MQNATPNTTLSADVASRSSARRGASPRVDRAAVDALEQRRLLSGTSGLTTGPAPILSTAGPADWWVPHHASQSASLNHYLVEGEFRIYSAIRNLDSSPMDAAGMRPIKVSYSDLYVMRPDGSLDRSQVDEERVRKRAREASDAGTPWVIDIEHWAIDIRTHSEAEVQATLDKFLQIIDWAKDERPDIQIGFYGILPLRDYWAPVELEVLNERAEADPNFKRRFPERFVEAHERIGAWQRANDFLQPLADAVDFVVPSLYTFYNEPEKWVVYAEANLAEAAQFGKPVVPFLWPEYHSSGPMAGQMVDAEFWQLQLDTVRAHADSVVIWGHAQTPVEGQAWWGPMVDFLDAHHSTPTTPTTPPLPRGEMPAKKSLFADNASAVAKPTFGNPYAIGGATHTPTTPTEALLTTPSAPQSESLTLLNERSHSGDQPTDTRPRSALIDRLSVLARANSSLFASAFDSGHARELLDSLSDDE